MRGKEFLMTSSFHLKLFFPSAFSLLYTRNPRNPFASSPPKSMAWSCSKCTFLNSPSQKSTCQICLSSSSSPSPSLVSSSSSMATSWSCKACTFSNTFLQKSCEVCGTRDSASLASSFVDLDSIGTNEELDSSVGSVFLPLRACSKRKIQEMVTTKEEPEPEPFREVGTSCDMSSPLRACSKRKIQEMVTTKEESEPFREVGTSCDMSSSRKEEAFLGTTKEIHSHTFGGDLNSVADSRTLKILSYNVWFREDLEMYKRMKAIGDLIKQHSPDVICFQEITPAIYDIFQEASWWKVYRCSLSKEMAYQRAYFCMQLSKLPVKLVQCKPFSNSIMGRELCLSVIDLGENKQLVVATSHLESPCPAPPTWNQMFSKERVAQAKEALIVLKDSPNAILCGDMNWDDKLDGKFPLPDGWVDAWSELRPGEVGYTYDTKSNQMLSGNRTLQKRLDRFLCGLQDFKISEIHMIGLEAIPDLSHFKEKRTKNEVKRLKLPVLPSDHYGLLLTICSK